MCAFNRSYLPGSFCLFVIAGMMLLLSSCAIDPGAKEPDGIPSEPAAIEGVITSISQDRTLRILVEENPQEKTYSSKILLGLLDETRIYYASGASAEPGDLSVGQRVRAWVTGPMLDSYPQQGAASVIVID